MKLSIHIKSFLANIFETSGLISRYLKKKSICNYLILMYHRIIPYKEAEPGMQEGMYVEPETFNMHIDYLKKYFEIIPLSEINSHINDMSSIKHFPRCVLTFDDGWYDFYKFAYPILVAQRVPATVFLPTKYIGTRNRFWTDQVTDIFVQKKNNKYTFGKKMGSNNNVLEKLESLEGPTNIKIERAISILKNYSDDEVFHILTEMQINLNIESVSSKRVFLNWEEVRKMAESGLITFGSHTNNHKILNYLNDDDIIDELVQSKNKLIFEKVVDPSFISFSYPNGNYDMRMMKMLEETGYNVAVTTEMGWNRPNAPCFALHRVPLHQDISSTKELFGCRIANIL
jgi:peptidoglycan/xylan/chitin deacetylase (PgdA/CDA1 family)